MVLLEATIKQIVSTLVTPLIGLATSLLEILNSSVKEGSLMRSEIQVNLSLMARDILYGLSSNHALFMLTKFLTSSSS